MDNTKRTTFTDPGSPPAKIVDQHGYSTHEMELLSGAEDKRAQKDFPMGPSYTKQDYKQLMPTMIQECIDMECEDRFIVDVKLDKVELLGNLLRMMGCKSTNMEQTTTQAFNHVQSQALVATLSVPPHSYSSGSGGWLDCEDIHVILERQK